MSSTLAVHALDSSEILRQITGQQVLERHLTPRIMFLSAMTTVLVGVAYADGQLAEQEKAYLQKVLNQLVSSRSGMRKLASLMLKGIRKDKTYTRLDAISCLTESLSASEKLIILGFGYGLAIADGHTEARERQYLDTVASAIDVPAQQVEALFSCLEGKQSEVKPDTIEELRWLLDPQRFQNIDAAIVNAASSLSSKFSAQAEHLSHTASGKLSYVKLEKFQGYQEQLSQICTDLLHVLQVEGNYDIFPSVLEDEVRSLAQKVKSQKFRLAIVGEFSQGKSTFLNALLGEELQPVRAIPCSGTLTVLKYGAEKRVICHYKDGTQAVIPFDQYQQQASIPEEAALGNLEHELAESNIAEIVLEHPGLALCRHHVEIVDSPGLNEHPDRTAVTERLLQDTDAAIFLANAQRPMTKGERDLLHSLKDRLQKENPEAPADNLFVLINFMDLLRSPKDAAQVKTLVENTVRNPAKPLVNSDNRVHFVSARSALEAALTQTSNEHSKPFAEFVSALETFLVEERGELTLKKGITDIQRFASGIQDGFKQMTTILEGKLNLSEAERRKILEQTGEISGFDTKIQVLTDILIDDTLSEVSDSWDRWLESIDARLITRAERWETECEGKKEILKDYEKQFVENMSEELDNWLTGSVMQTILKPKVEELESEIIRKLAAIKHDLRSIDEDAGTNLHKQFELSGLGVNLNFHSKLSPESVKDPTSFLGGLGLFGGGALAVGGLAFTSLTMFPIFLAGGLVGGVIGFSVRTTEEMKQELKQEAFNKGIDKLTESFEPMLDKVVENIEIAFNRKAQNFHEAASASISILCNLLEQQENVLKETLAQKETESALIQEKSLQLQAIETALDDLTKAALS
ncbi:MAG: dynamin family protein [Cyanobacteria bacterium J06634_6]